MISAKKWYVVVGALVASPGVFASDSESSGAEELGWYLSGTRYTVSIEAAIDAHNKSQPAGKRHFTLDDTWFKGVIERVVARKNANEENVKKWFYYIVYNRLKELEALYHNQVCKHPRFRSSTELSNKMFKQAWNDYWIDQARKKELPAFFAWLWQPLTDDCDLPF